MPNDFTLTPAKAHAEIVKTIKKKDPSATYSLDGVYKSIRRKRILAIKQPSGILISESSLKSFLRARIV